MTETDWWLVVMAISGYLLGSVPFGILVSKALGTVDPRTAGSRNIGFTNVLRVSGKKAGALTLIGDFGKGWVVGWAAIHYLENGWWPWVIALSVVIGHLHSIFLRFRGGKGVATALGSTMGVAPWMGIIALMAWLVTAGVSRYSSGAALAAFIVLPLVAGASGSDQRFLLFTMVVSALIVWRHKDNIRRLANGTEPRIGHRRESVG